MLYAGVCLSHGMMQLCASVWYKWWWELVFTSAWLKCARNENTIGWQVCIADFESYWMLPCASAFVKWWQVVAQGVAVAPRHTYVNGGMMMLCTIGGRWCSAPVLIRMVEWCCSRPKVKWLCSTPALIWPGKMNWLYQWWHDLLCTCACLKWWYEFVPNQRLIKMVIWIYPCRRLIEMRAMYCWLFVSYWIECRVNIWPCDCSVATGENLPCLMKCF